MKLLALSDLHLEFAPFVPDPAAVAAADVVVLAGDIHQGARGMAWARSAFTGKRIIYVAGNHEFYGHHWDAHLALLRAQAGLHGIDFLENDTVTIDGIRFLARHTVDGFRVLWRVPALTKYAPGRAGLK